MAKAITVFDSGTRTGTAESPLFSNWEDMNALHLVVDIATGGNLAVTVLGHDGPSDEDYTILTSVLPTGTTVLKIGPDYTAGANVAKDYLPAYFKVTAAASGSTTYSIGGSII